MGSPVTRHRLLQYVDGSMEDAVAIIERAEGAAG
jgi:hypothetical protein